MGNKIDIAQVEDFMARQLQDWELARKNFTALKDVKVKELDVDGWKIKVQFNPARIVSTGANVSADAIKKRKCFLCGANRPEAQESLKWNEYDILVNPFPIFPRHFTIPDERHLEQVMSDRVGDMYRLANMMAGYTVFYNGAKCGASAPDHMHFQAGNSDFLTIWNEVEKREKKALWSEAEAEVMTVPSLPVNIVVIDAKSENGAIAAMAQLVSRMPKAAGESEPMMNVLARKVGEGVEMVVIPRKKHRPSFYGNGDGEMLISPASVDLGGVIITPLERDFEAINEETIKKLIAEVCYSDDDMTKLETEAEPKVTVGIKSGEKVAVVLNGEYNCRGAQVKGRQEVSVANGQLVWNGEQVGDELLFEPTNGDCVVTIEDVTIGVNFHWQRNENQQFVGGVKMLADGEKVVVINVVAVEDYLKSVISSEMSANASEELLKAHAVISRSWLLAQINAKHNKSQCSEQRTDEEIVKWYDREDHDKFDVCADDHCQRYQGITRQTRAAVAQAVEATRGEVLMADGELCDARFSKCCGGVFEEFENCWEPVHHSYLTVRRDGVNEQDYRNLRIEANADAWIRGNAEAFCNTKDAKVLSQVLNNYDQETADFYRWTVSYEQSELSELVKRKSGIDFGDIEALEPVERGTSGRLVKLRIVGSKRTMTIGKELEIRRILSETHLYSSAFVVERDGSRFVLRGAGWGHGVGLCQIGAAVMGAQGYKYQEILRHYFAEAEVVKRY
jgi:SpoIID/LytB domain protein